MNAADVVWRMAEGDRAAFRRLYDRHARLVLALVIRIVGDHPDPGRVLEAAFWNAWQSAASYDPARGTPEAWLLWQARGLALDEARAASPAMRAAPQEPLALAYYGGASQTDIAARLEQPLSTVRRDIAGALERLGVPPGATDHEPFETWAVLYAVGALDGDDLARLQSHRRAGCARCDDTVRAVREALVALVRESARVEPPGEVRESLVRRVETSSRPRPRRWGWLPWATATAGLAIAAAGFSAGVVAARYEKQMGFVARETARVRDQVRREEARLREDVDAARVLAALMADPATRVVPLRAAAGSAATGRVVWHDRLGGRLYVAGLPPPPPGRVYQLWALGDAPRPQGHVPIDAAGGGSRPILAGEPASGFAITLEPTQNPERPTGEVILTTR